MYSETETEEESEKEAEEGVNEYGIYRSNKASHSSFTRCVHGEMRESISMLFVDDEM